MDNGKNDAHEQPAVKTTIVGGRPPGTGKGLGGVPRGIEIMLKKSVVDAKFRAEFLQKKAAAAALIELKLSDSEKSILNAIPVVNLEKMIAATCVHPNLHPAFMTYTAAVMLAAISAAGVCQAEGRQVGPEDSNYIIEQSTGGVRADMPAEPVKPFLGYYEDANVTKVKFRVAVKGKDGIALSDKVIVELEKKRLSEKTSPYNTEGGAYVDHNGAALFEEVPVGIYDIQVLALNRAVIKEIEYEVKADVDNDLTITLGQ